MKSLIIATLFGLAACGGTPTESTCPTANAPSYGNFGMTFFSTYCTDCHSATSTDRHDAPTDVNFDTEADIKMHLDDIDTEAAAGPNATNTDMPQRTDTNVAMPPTQAERETLGQFLACEQGRHRELTRACA